MSEKQGTPENLSEEQLQGAVQSIVSDPAFGRMLAQLQGKDTAESPPQIPPVTPEMMAKLPQMMQTLAPLLGGGSTGKAPPEGKSSAADADRRKKLLAALKPYLSDHRRDAVDSILRVTEMTELLGGLGHKNKE